MSWRRARRRSELQTPLRLIHDHLARVPAQPADVNPAVPAPLSDIIMHLLEKEPDNRYQTADGVIYDLERVRDARTHQESPGLRVGEHDVPLRLLLPSRLVGRDDEQAARSPHAVARDVGHGWLDRADATRVYAVAWDREGGVDETGTERLREQRLRARLTAAAPPPAGTSPRLAADGADLRPVGGDLGVLLDDGRPVEWVSLTGRVRLGPVTEDYRVACAVRQTPVNAMEPEFATRPGAAMLLREYLCPVTGLRLGTEIIRSGDDPAADKVLAGGAP